MGRWRTAVLTPWSIYNFLVFALECFCLILSRVSRRMESFLEGRNIDKLELKRLIGLRQNFQNCIVCFISSAGEYEQALPVLERLERKYSVVSILIFFSKSGISFATKRGEKRPFMCAPLDRTTLWLPLLKSLRPDVCLIVRHELWPAFLWSAQQLCPVFLIDVTTSHHRDKQSIKQQISTRLKKWLYSYISHIMIVDEKDALNLSPLLTKATRTHVVGDTKYDRVLERSIHNKSKQTDILQLKFLASQEASKLRFFIIGSAWQQDVEIVCRAFKKFRESGLVRYEWRIIVVPHDLSAENMKLIIESIRLSGFSERSMSQGISNLHAEFIIADKLGILAELYAIGNMALVGGAFHHRVHNVLEPAAHGLYIACGPRYKTSREAILLAEKGLLKVVANEQDLCAWWEQMEFLIDEPHLELKSYLKQQSGASDKIASEIENYLVRP